MQPANKRNEMTPAKGQKYAHPVCSCVIASAGIAAVSARLWKRRRTSIVPVCTPAARAERPNKQCVQRLVNEPQVTQMKNSKLLVVVDESPATRKALQYVAQMAADEPNSESAWLIVSWHLLAS